MKKKEEIEKEYQVKAKYFVDALFDNGLLNKELSRDGLNALEDLVAFEYQSFADSNKRTLEFVARMEDWKKKHNK